MIRKRYIHCFGGILFSWVLLFVSLWQLEIATGWVAEYFDFPFFLWRVNKWFARDFWYLIIMVSMMINTVASYFLGEAREKPREKKHEVRNPELPS